MGHPAETPTARWAAPPARGPQAPASPAPGPSRAAAWLTSGPCPCCCSRCPYSCPPRYPRAHAAPLAPPQGPACSPPRFSSTPHRFPLPPARVQPTAHEGGNFVVWGYFPGGGAWHIAGHSRSRLSDEYTDSDAKTTSLCPRGAHATETGHRESGAGMGTQALCTRLLPPATEAESTLPH